MVNEMVLYAMEYGNGFFFLVGAEEKIWGMRYAFERANLYIFCYKAYIFFLTSIYTRSTTFRITSCYLSHPHSLLRDDQLIIQKYICKRDIYGFVEQKKSQIFFGARMYVFI